MLIFDFSTLWANHLTDLFASKYILNKILSFCLFEAGIDPVEQNIEEFLCILLFHNFGGRTIIFLKGKAPSCWVVVWTLR